VFGSNLQDQHGVDAAHTTLKWRTIMDQGVSLQGQTYAIPTMFSNTDLIKPYIDEFIEFAMQYPNLTYLVTAIG